MIRALEPFGGGDLPQGWGPGPWDDDWYDTETFTDRAYQCGDLRVAIELEYGHRIAVEPRSAGGHGGQRGVPKHAR